MVGYAWYYGSNVEKHFWEKVKVQSAHFQHRILSLKLATECNTYAHTHTNTHTHKHVAYTLTAI